MHHDLWDTDLPPQPTLVEVIHDGKKIPALVQAGKTGLIFILDRRDGKPIYGMEERPVAKGDVPGEWYSPTQPFPLKPPPLARMTWKPEEIAGFTSEHRKYCEDLFKDAQNDGPFAPVRMTNTVVFPGPDGGFNWGGGSFDPKLGYFFINSHDRGEVTRMVARTPGSTSSKGAPVDESTQGGLRSQERREHCQSSYRLALPVSSVGRILRDQCEHRRCRVENPIRPRRIA